MKIVIPGGNGQLGELLRTALGIRGHDVTVISRRATRNSADLTWDGKTVGAWAEKLEGADAVINLAGRSVNCRYTRENLEEMMSSRVQSTLSVGQAIEQTATPPKVWLQMSTATIYAHSFGSPNDELTGTIGGHEPDAPNSWRNSIEIAQAWEAAQKRSVTPATRKVALRTAMVMSPDPGGIFDVLLRLARFRLGGPIAGGRQFISWIHADDFTDAIEYLIEHELEGAINVCAPAPLPQRDFMEALRSAWGTRIGLPTTKWMAELGAIFLRTETELTLKSRRVVPGRLTDAGFKFAFPEWPKAAADLVTKWQQQGEHSGEA